MDTILMVEPSGALEPSELVAEWRRSAGMTQEKLADRLPVGVDMLRKIETGTAKPSVETARALDQALGTGGAIFRAYFSRPDDDDVERLRARVAEMSHDLHSLSETVEQLAGQVRQLLDRREPPPAESQ